MRRKVVVTLADGSEIEQEVAAHSRALALWIAVGNFVTGELRTGSQPVEVRFAAVPSPTGSKVAADQSHEGGS